MHSSLFELTRIKEENTYNRDGLTLAFVESKEDGFSLAKSILYEVVTSRTLLYLSGGKTPKELYEAMTKEEILRPGAVGLVDERYGERFHESSNETMLKESGLLGYLEHLSIPFYPMLQADLSREETAEKYDQLFRELNNTYQKSVATLGIGIDGHIAGIAGNRHDFHNPMFEDGRKTALVSEFNDQKGMFKTRVSMTFLGLSMLDILLVLVFGEDKKHSLEAMFTTGSEEEIPARFLRRTEIAKKTILITDQNIM